MSTDRTGRRKNAKHDRQSYVKGLVGIEKIAKRTRTSSDMPSSTSGSFEQRAKGCSLLNGRR